MATPIVLQLQQDALDKDVAVSDLLRKAKVVATKLDLKDALEWIELELDGYMTRDNAEMPQYRWVSGEPRGLDPWNGRWLPIMFTGDAKVQRIISRKPLGQSVTELEHWLTRRHDDRGELMISFEPQQIKTLWEALEIEPTQIGLFIGLDRMKGIVGAVRNKVLDWSLSLEKAGILGDGVSFSPKEKATAKDPRVVYQINTIENFIGSIGPASGHATVNATQTKVFGTEDLLDLIGQIKKNRDGLDLSPEQRAELDGHVTVIEGELSKVTPDRTKVKERFGAIRRVAEGVTSNVVAEGIVGMIGRIPWDSLPL